MQPHVGQRQPDRARRAAETTPANGFVDRRAREMLVTVRRA